jgi:hypothetical protein
MKKIVFSFLIACFSISLAALEFPEQLVLGEGAHGKFNRIIHNDINNDAGAAICHTAIYQFVSNANNADQVPDLTLCFNLFPEQKTISLSLTHFAGLNAEGRVIKKIACSGAVLIEDLPQDGFELFLRGFSRETIVMLDGIVVPAPPA